LSFKFVVFSLQQMVKNLKLSSINYKLCTTNFKEKGALHDGRSLRATGPFKWLVVSGSWLVNGFKFKTIH
jgi:hypothetical protein